jgi:mannose-1-phosphate guanylyltransferase/mannose-6-phosphate isomerase
VVTGVDHLELVLESLERVGVDAVSVLVEPSGRNTAPAAAAAALAVDQAEVLVLLPADHLMTDEDRFRHHVASAADRAADGSIVTFGVVPTRPETGYGYIETGAPDGEARRVARFKEKPEPSVAIEMAADGRHLWNSGMFVVGAGMLLSEMGRTCPSVVEGVGAAMPTDHGGVSFLDRSFTDVPAISFDHAVMEHTDRALVIPIDVGWDDIGSYRALMGYLEKDRDGNAVSGPVILDRVSDSFVVATDRTMAVSGVEGMVVVETADGVLVIPLEEAQAVKELAERAQTEG